MAKIESYHKKRRLMEQLSRELQKLEEDQEVKQEFQFETDLKQLLDQHGLTAADAANILTASHPINTKDLQRSGSKRPLKTFTNPHTGEVVQARGGNHKTLRQWRDKHGVDAVASWAT